MNALSAQEIGRNLIEMRLIRREDLNEAMENLPAASSQELLRYLERRSLLTSYQLQKVENGDRIGYYIGRFKVLYKISAGTFARVFRGVDSTTGESVAIKVLRSRHTLDPENVKNFYREAKLTESLDHPNIARRLDVGVDKETNQHYIAMEFVEGGNFREFLKIRGKIEARELARLGVEMVEGLKYALSKGVTHRDIKPTNILFTSTGHIKWVDFGLAGIAQTKSGERTFATEQRTVDYAGLERASGAPNGDWRSDIFFLGAVFYEALLGEPPLSATKNKQARMLRHRFDQIRPLAESPEIPQDLARIVDRMLAFRPEDRYQDYDALLTDLKRFVDGGAPTAPQPQPVASYEGSSGSLAAYRSRLILVHKSPQVQEAVRKNFSAHGFRVAITSDLERAVNLLALQGADCIVIDLDTCRRETVESFPSTVQRKAPRAKDLPAVLLHQEGQEAWASSFDPNVTALVKKPVTLGQVYRAVRKFVPR